MWSIEQPNLYDFVFTITSKKNNKVLDKVKSYGGMRSIEVKKNKVYLNNKPLYQRLVLDQGFYPDGIWTAPTDKDLKKDIILSMKAGFNGARLHEKVFEDRFHYWADKLGYITWAEWGNWGANENAKGTEQNGKGVIFDPASWWADSEVDIAMTRLFGGFNREFYEGYHQVIPLKKGFEKRVIIYNFYHILNHANMFGGSYIHQVQDYIKRIITL